MPTIALSQSIAEPAAEVFAVVSDVAAYAQWNPTIAGARLLSDGAVGDGTPFEFRIKRMGRQALEVTNFEAGRSIRLEPRSGMMDGGHRFTLSEEGGGTRVDHELVMQPKGVLRLLGPLMAMVARRKLRQTADALEARVAALRAAR